MWYLKNLMNGDRLIANMGQAPFRFVQYIVLRHTHLRDAYRASVKPPSFTRFQLLISTIRPGFLTRIAPVMYQNDNSAKSILYSLQYAAG